MTITNLYNFYLTSLRDESLTHIHLPLKLIHWLPRLRQEQSVTIGRVLVTILNHNWTARDDVSFAVTLRHAPVRCTHCEFFVIVTTDCQCQPLHYRMCLTPLYCKADILCSSYANNYARLDAFVRHSRKRYGYCADDVSHSQFSPVTDLFTVAVLNNELHVVQQLLPETRSSAVAERPRVASCHWIFC